MPGHSELGSFGGSCRTVNGEGQFVRWVDSFEDSGICQVASTDDGEYKIRGLCQVVPN